MSEYEPAFPPNAGWSADDVRFRGMSLRDYFAGQALAGLYASSSTDGDLHVDIARSAYGAADAMLAARTKEPTP